MQNIRFIVIGLMFFSILLNNSCKEPTTPAPEPTKESLLTGADWKYTYYSYNIGAGDIDVLANWQACQRDDLLKFNYDKTKTIIKKQGATACSPEDPEVENYGRWYMSADKTMLFIVDVSVDTSSFMIEVLTDTKLKINGVSKIGGNIANVKMWMEAVSK